MAVIVEMMDARMVMMDGIDVAIQLVMMMVILVVMRMVILVGIMEAAAKRGAVAIQMVDEIDVAMQMMMMHEVSLFHQFGYYLFRYRFPCNRRSCIFYILKLKYYFDALG